MTATDTIAALALAVAIVAAIAAVGSWKAARNSYVVAATLSRIDEQRLHADLTPVFRCTIVANKAGSQPPRTPHDPGVIWGAQDW
ncbi:hypothetical protein [Streptomyces flaveolus]|uniref:hypothetical protein n=1 Tax=Streptomyces flaveolus TaxID=67297 RepID=UPI003700FFE6